MQRLAIITTHPIQYNAPLFRLLTERKKIAIKVFYTWGQSGTQVFDPDFGVYRKWDIPLLDAYEYEFVENTSSKPGSNHFFGIINPDIISRINEWKPDALLVYGWAFSSHLKVIRYFKGKLPVFFRGDSTLIDEAKGVHYKKIVRRFLLKYIYQYIDIALFTGLKNKEYYIVHGVKESQLVFAPHAIDNNRFEVNHDLEQKAVEWRKDNSINYDSIVFLFAGKFHPKKDPLILIKAFREINNTNAHLVLAGDGVLYKEMKNLAMGLPNIHFLTFQNQSQMPLLYHLCDVFILPSRGPGETWGLAINEAMAAGKPVLVSDKVGCGADLVIDSENGYIFPAGNCMELVSKLNLFINRRNELKQMGQKSQVIIQNWNFSNLADVIENQLNYSLC